MPPIAAATRPEPAGPPGGGALGDLRFRALLAEEAWAALPAPIRRRFSKRLAAGETIVYLGSVTDAAEAAPVAGWRRRPASSARPFPCRTTSACPRP